jgi:hypothetical protein
MRRSLSECRQQVTDGLRLGQRCRRKTHAERSLNAKNQLGSPQAVDAKITVEPAG